MILLFECLLFRFPLYRCLQFMKDVIIGQVSEEKLQIVDERFRDVTNQKPIGPIARSRFHCPERSHSVDALNTEITD